MARNRRAPSRVKGAKAQKFSTQLFDYQIEIIKKLSRRRANPIAVINRFAVDLYIVAFREYLQGYNIDIPEELTKITLEEFVLRGTDHLIEE